MNLKTPGQLAWTRVAMHGRARVSAPRLVPQRRPAWPAP
jgi:hypothetical protein